MSARERRFWLLKTDPEELSFGDLWRAPRRTTGWDGVRNFQARNFIRDGMALGDGVLIHHSGGAGAAGEAPGIAGLAEVASAAYPDPTQFERGHERFEPRATPERPVWFQVDVRAVQPFAEPLTLAGLREVPALAGMGLLKRGNRLSVQPVGAAEWAAIVALAGPPAAPRTASGRARGRGGA
jgi:predicted RNA-binding protein with PUA-like domain